MTIRKMTVSYLQVWKNFLSPFTTGQCRPERPTTRWHHLALEELVEEGHVWAHLRPEELVNGESCLGSP
jgi:hypothetical protein